MFSYSKIQAVQLVVHGNKQAVHLHCFAIMLAASCKLQQYDAEGCKTCASLAGLLVSFTVVVIDALTTTYAATHIPMT